MNEELIYSVASGLILLVIYSSLNFRKMNKGRINKAFMSLVMVTIVATIFDILVILFDGDSSKPASFKLILAVIYYISKNVSFALYSVYVIAVTDTSHKLGTGFKKKLLSIPVIVTVIASLSTLFVNDVFLIDNNGFFVRGPLIVLIYVCNGVYLALPMIIIVKYWRNLGFRKSLALFSCAIGSLAAYCIGSYFPYLHFDLIAYTLGILFIMLIVMNPESKVDSQSGLLRHEAYFDELKTGYVSSKKIYIIQINIRDFETITNMFSYEKLGVLISYLSDRILLMCKRLSISGENYYIKDGEFRVVIPMDYPTNIERDAKAIYNIFNGGVNYSDINIELSSVVCVSKCPDDFKTFDDLYDFETRLKKFNGIDKIYYANQIIKNKEYTILSHMDEILERAFDEGNLEVYYQPIYNVKEKNFPVAEALIRLHDKEYGDIEPEFFLPVAEKNGYMDRIGQFVLEEICKFVSSAAFTDCGFKCIDMNLSVEQCLKNNLCDWISTTLKKYDVDPTKIYVGITESIATEGQKNFSDNIKKIQELGLGITLDGFGIGYSNIVNLSYLPIRAVKFDRKFINTGENNKQEAVLDSSIEMIKSLGKKVVIEGVETEEQVRKFEFLQCDYIQGFYFSKPVPLKHLLCYIREYKLGS